MPSPRKLTPDQAAVAIQLLEQGDATEKALAKYFGVTAGAISHIKAGRTYREVFRSDGNPPLPRTAT